MAKAFQVGDTFQHVRECDKYRPIYYAGASGDFNAIHIDKEIGELAGLGGTVLHGMCTLAWAVEAATRFVGDPGKVSRVSVRFSRPVAIGDVITFNGKVTAADDKKLEANLSAKNQRGEDVLKNATVEFTF